MKNHWISVVVGSAICTGLVSSPLNAAPERLSVERLDSGDTKANHDQVKAVLADVIDRAVGEGGIDNLLQVIAKSDRERLDKGLNKREKDRYAAAATEVRNMWKETFGEDFSFAKHKDVLDDVTIDISQDGKRERANVNFPAAAGRSAFEMHLIREGTNDWRVMLPDRVDGDAFLKNMNHGMELLVNEKTKLKKNEITQAYRDAASQLLHAMVFEH